MEQLSPKQREIRDRESLILQVARGMIEQSGSTQLNMDKIASETGVSKGTIYQHFLHRDDILVALAGQSMAVRYELFSRAAAFKGKPRERVEALGQAAGLFFQLHPMQFKLEMLLQINSVRQRASDQWRNLLHSSEIRCMTMVAGIVRDGIASGDLELETAQPEDVSFGLWSMSIGAQSIIASGTQLMELGVSAPNVAMYHNYRALLDGYNWKPLSCEWDFEQVQQRIAEEVFAQEWKEVGQRAQTR